MQNIFLVSMELKKGGLKVLFGELDMAASLMGVKTSGKYYCFLCCCEFYQGFAEQIGTEVFSVSSHSLTYTKKMKARSGIFHGLLP